MANKATFLQRLKITEDVDLSAYATDPTITHDMGDVSSSYTQGGTPDHDTAWSVDGRAQSTGDIDLTQITDSKGDALDLTGKKIHAIFIRCDAANAAKLTFQEHATNGYGIFGLGTSVILEPGASILLLANGGNEAVSGTAKIIDIDGTSGDTFDMVISAGD